MVRPMTPPGAQERAAAHVANCTCGYEVLGRSYDLRCVELRLTLVKETSAAITQAVQAERERWADQAENFPLEYARELAVPVLKRFVDALRAHPAEPAGEKG